MTSEDAVRSSDANAAGDHEGDEAGRGLRTRRFRLLLAARSIDVLGTALAPLALGFAVLDMDGSVSDIGAVVGARSLGLVVLVILGGVLADRYPRSILLVASNLLAAVSQGAIAILVLTGEAGIPVMVALAGISGGADGLSLPTASALVPDVVPQHLIPRANALLASSTSTSRIAGLLGGTTLVLAVGPGWALLADAMTFAVTALLFSGIPAKRARAPQSDSSFLSELVAGARLLRKMTWVWLVIGGFLLFNLANAATLTVLGPAVADETFGRGVWGVSLALQAAGIVVIGLILNRFRINLRLSRGLVLASGSALFTLSMALGLRVPVIAAAALLSGLCLGYLTISWDSNLQSHVSSEHLARIYSFDFFGSIIAIPVGQVMAGPISRSIGLRPSLFLIAGVTFFSFVLLPTSSALRDLPAPETR